MTNTITKLKLKNILYFTTEKTLPYGFLAMWKEKASVYSYVTQLNISHASDIHDEESGWSFVAGEYLRLRADWQKAGSPLPDEWPHVLNAECMLFSESQNLWHIADDTEWQTVYRHFLWYVWKQDDYKETLLQIDRELIELVDKEFDKHYTPEVKAATEVIAKEWPLDVNNFRMEISGTFGVDGDKVLELR